MSLSNRVFRGGVWLGMTFASSRLLGLLRLTLLTRLLLPEDFGLITIVTLVVSSMWVLTDTGVAAAVIQKKNPNDAFLHTAWHISWLRGIILAIICWLIAPVLALFFEHAELERLLHWAALIPLVQGFESLGMTLLKKELQFKQKAYVDLTREIVQTVIAVLLVMYWQANALSVVLGIVMGVIAATLLSYVMHHYRPVLHYDKTAMHEIWSYGSHIMGAGILVFAMTNLDDVVVGKMLGVTQLGFYGVAFTLAGLLTNQLVQVFNTVMFPALSQIQEDDMRIKHVLYLSVRMMAGVLTPVIAFVTLFPEALVSTILGEKWLPIVGVLLVLLCMGWVRGIATVFGPILMARKKTKVLHKMKWFEFILFSLTIIPAVSWFGVVGAAIVLLMVYGLSLFLHIQAVHKDIILDGKYLFLQVLHGVLPSAVAFTFAMLWHSFYPEHGLWLIGMLFTCIWALILWARERSFIYKVIEMVRQK